MDRFAPIREPFARQMGRPFRTLRARWLSPLAALEGLENHEDYLRPPALPETKSTSAEWNGIYEFVT
jgi:hypothetical protein